MPEKTTKNFLTLQLIQLKINSSYINKNIFSICNSAISCSFATLNYSPRLQAAWSILQGIQQHWLSFLRWPSWSPHPQVDLFFFFGPVQTDTVLDLWMTREQDALSMECEGMDMKQSQRNEDNNIYTQHHKINETRATLTIYSPTPQSPWGLSNHGSCLRAFQSDACSIGKCVYFLLPIAAASAPLTSSVTGAGPDDVDAAGMTSAGLFKRAAAGGGLLWKGLVKFCSNLTSICFYCLWLRLLLLYKPVLRKRECHG